MPNITINPENVKKDFIKIKSDSKKIEYLFEWKRNCEKARINLNPIYVAMDAYKEFHKLVSWIDIEIHYIQSKLNFQQPKVIVKEVEKKSLSKKKPKVIVKEVEKKSLSKKKPKVIVKEVEKKSLSKKKPKLIVERINWNLSEDSLNEFFKDLIGAGFIQEFKKYQIFNHFFLKLSKDNPINNNYEDFKKIVWLKSPTLFAIFINTLKSKAITIPNHKKFKIFCNHFHDDKFQEFDPKQLAKLANQAKSNKTDPHEELTDLINSLK